MSEKKKDPWTDPDPQPGDFDEYLDKIEWTEFIPERDLGKGHKSVEETARRQALRHAQNAEAAAKL